MAMLMIFINCGFYIATALGVFGPVVGGVPPPGAPETAYGEIEGFINASFKIGGLSFIGRDIILAIAVIMIFATALILNSRAFSSQGVAIGVFAGVFWVSIGLTDVILFNIQDPYGGLKLFIGIYNIAAFLIFVNALVQMPTGGQKAHV